MWCWQRLGTVGRLGDPCHECARYQRYRIDRNFLYRSQNTGHARLADRLYRGFGVTWFLDQTLCRQVGYTPPKWWLMWCWQRLGTVGRLGDPCHECARYQRYRIDRNFLYRSQNTGHARLADRLYRGFGVTWFLDQTLCRQVGYTPPKWWLLNDTRPIVMEVSWATLSAWMLCWLIMMWLQMHSWNSCNLN